jgi:hypothetical protein
VERRSWNPAIIAGVTLGAVLGAIAAVLLLRKWRRGTDVYLTDIRWSDVIALVGPVVALTRRLVEMSRRELVERDMT